LERYRDSELSFRPHSPDAHRPYVPLVILSPAISS
jgi:hypothetical protein